MIGRRTFLRGNAATKAVTKLGRPRPAGAEPPRSKQQGLRAH